MVIVVDAAFLWPRRSPVILTRTITTTVYRPPFWNLTNTLIPQASSNHIFFSIFGNSNIRMAVPTTLSSTPDADAIENVDDPLANHPLELPDQSPSDEVGVTTDPQTVTSEPGLTTSTSPSILPSTVEELSTTHTITVSFEEPVLASMVISSAIKEPPLKSEGRQSRLSESADGDGDDCPSQDPDCHRMSSSPLEQLEPPTSEKAADEGCVYPGRDCGTAGVAPVQEPETQVPATVKDDDCPYPGQDCGRASAPSEKKPNPFDDKEDKCPYPGLDC